MALIRRPFDVFGMRKDFDSLFDNIFTSSDDTNAATAWTPSVDISDDKDHFYITADVPGLKKEELKINVKGNVLTFCGEKKQEKEEKDKNYYRSERVYGSFCRSFELPDAIDKDKIKAEYKEGVLNLTVPKAEEAKPREIEIKVS